MRKSHSPLFHQTLKIFKELGIQNKKMLVGVSGGMDSMVLMSLLQELSSVCQLELFICYIHHGLTQHKKTKNYREKAYKLISQTCEKNTLVFLSSKSKKSLKSEEDFRNFRHSEFQKFLKQKQADWIVLAHNQNDLLETRLINLIRGTGLQGLNSMKFYQAPYLRPLLNISREEIKKYAKACKLSFLEDPSNKDNFYLRNWIRKKWLKDLEKKRAGSIKSLSKSLELLSQENHFFKKSQFIFPEEIKITSLKLQPYLENNNTDKNNSLTDKSKNETSQQNKLQSKITGKNETSQQNQLTLKSKIAQQNKFKSKTKPTGKTELTGEEDSLLTGEGINRKLFIELSLEDQKRFLASYMRKAQLSNYGQSHIQELLKHNKRVEKQFQVKLLKKLWIFTNRYIKVKH